jgi:hypothetical protein
MSAFGLSRVTLVCLFAGGVIAACSATPTNNGFTTGSGTSSGSGGAGSGSGGSGTGAMDSTGAGFFDGGFGGQGQGGGSGCAAETQFVYTLTAANELYRFNPPTLDFTLVGVLDCPGFATPYSMAVDRNGQAWSVFTDGNLYKFDTKTAHCTPTSFVPGQSGFLTFGMGFSANAPGSSDETLFVSDSAAGSGSTQGLAKIDTQTLTLTPIAAYDKITARAEMTGTGDARLFGAFEGSPYVVAEIDKSNAHILSQAPQTAINYAPGSSNFAFAFWGGDFWLFVGPGFQTDVFHYKPSDGSTTNVKTVPFEIVGAGVSTCAPIKPPN